MIYHNICFFQSKESSSATSSKMVKICFNNTPDDVEAICEAEIKEEPMDFD